MIKALTLFNKDNDLDAVEGAIASLKSSLKGTAGFLSMTLSKGDLMSPGGPSEYSKVVEFSFESLEDFMAWTQSPDAKANRDLMINEQTVSVFYEVEEW